MSARVLHEWTTGGQRWECDAYDHGPFCRQCRRAGAVPADRIHFDGSTAWRVMDHDYRVGEGMDPDRPCDTCMGDEDYWPDPDCGSSGRHVFDLRVECRCGWSQHGDGHLYRVHVVPGMVVPIGGDGRRTPWPGAHVEVVGNESYLWVGPHSTDMERITLPPAAKPGMWAVKLAIVE